MSCYPAKIFKVIQIIWNKSCQYRKKNLKNYKQFPICIGLSAQNSGSVHMQTVFKLQSYNTECAGKYCSCLHQSKQSQKTLTPTHILDHLTSGNHTQSALYNLTQCFLSNIHTHRYLGLVSFPRIFGRQTGTTNLWISRWPPLLPVTQGD